MRPPASPPARELRPSPVPAIVPERSPLPGSASASPPAAPALRPPAAAESYAQAFGTTPVPGAGSAAVPCGLSPEPEAVPWVVPKRFRVRHARRKKGRQGGGVLTRPCRIVLRRAPYLWLSVRVFPPLPEDGRVIRDPQGVRVYREINLLIEELRKSSLERGAERSYIAAQQLHRTTGAEEVQLRLRDASDLPGDRSPRAAEPAFVGEGEDPMRTGNPELSLPVTPARRATRRRPWLQGSLRSSSSASCLKCSSRSRARRARIGCQFSGGGR